MILFSNYEKDFEDQMRIGNYSPLTAKHYKSDVLIFFQFFKEKPSIKHISAKEIIEWLLTYQDYDTRKSKHCAVKWLYKKVIHQPCKFDFVPYGKKEKKLPSVLDHEELYPKIMQIENFKHRTILAFGYCCGLRVSEICNLKIEDVKESQLLIFIRQGKGKKDRVCPISGNMLLLYQLYIEKYNPSEYVFNGESKNTLKYSHRSCEELIKKYIGDYGFHVLRHSSFTKMVDDEVNLAVIQRIAGHGNINTTRHYCHISNKILKKVPLAI